MSQTYNLDGASVALSQVGLYAKRSFIPKGTASIFKMYLSVQNVSRRAAR